MPTDVEITEIDEIEVARLDAVSSPANGIPFLLFNGSLFGLIDTHLWGTWLLVIAAVLTIWSMVYYLQKAIPEIRAKTK